MTSIAIPFSGRTTQNAVLASRIVLILAFAAFFIAALHPDVRSSMHTALVKDYRIILSTARGDLLGTGSEMTVAKIRTRDGLFIEIYEAKDDGSQRLVERFELADKKDGYFNFNGQATNLAIDDVDGDGRPEILVPSFDQNLVGHLNIYRYDQGGFHRALR